MQTVVLAAGDGEGLEPVSSSVPKPLLPVGGVPLVVRVARRAVAAGATELVVVVPPYCRPFVRALGDAVDDVPVRYAVQPRPMGTANALVAARSHLDDDFVVLPGDALFAVADLASIYATVPAVAVRGRSASRTRRVLVGDGGPLDVSNLGDDRAGTYVDAGACSLPAAAMHWTRPSPNDDGERDLAAVVERTAADHDVRPVVVGDHVDVDDPPRLLAANRRAFDEWTGRHPRAVVGGAVDEVTRLHGRVRVASGASVASGAAVEGPAVVEQGAVVEPNAYVRPYSYVGPDVTVEHSTEVSNAILLEGARVGPLAEVVDSVLAPDAAIGAETTVAGCDHRGLARGEDLPAERDGEAAGDGFGVVVGEGATVGAGVRVERGVVVPRYERVEDGTTRRRADDR